MNNPHTQQQSTPSAESTTHRTNDRGLQTTQRNQPHSQSVAVPPGLLALASISILLLIVVGGALFCFPEFSQSRWLWKLRPFNTRFLGAIYLTALVGLSSMVLFRRAALTRLIIPMMWVFTTVVLMVSCLQLQQFGAERRATDIWFLLYLVDCVGATYYWGFFRGHKFLGLRRLPTPWAVGLGIQSGILGVYGLGLLLSPVAAGGAWLWPLDVFHAQLYSSIFLTGAVGSALLSRSATAAETRTLGAVQVTFSSLVLLGIALVDEQMQMIEWWVFANWAWMGAIAILGLIGLGLIKQSRNMSQNSVEV